MLLELECADFDMYYHQGNSSSVWQFLTLSPTTINEVTFGLIIH